jgi:hypothetical protein
VTADLLIQRGRTGPAKAGKYSHAQ